MNGRCTTCTPAHPPAAAPPSCPRRLLVQAAWAWARVDWARTAFCRASARHQCSRSRAFCSVRASQRPGLARSPQRWPDSELKGGGLTPPVSGSLGVYLHRITSTPFVERNTALRLPKQRSRMSDSSAAVAAPVAGAAAEPVAAAAVGGAGAGAAAAEDAKSAADAAAQPQLTSDGLVMIGCEDMPEGTPTVKG